MLWDVARKKFLHLSAFLFHASPVLGFKFWVLSYKLLLCDLLIFCLLYWFSRTRSLDASHVLRPDPHKPSCRQTSVTRGEQRFLGRRVTLLWWEEGKCFFFRSPLSPVSGLVCKNNQNQHANDDVNERLTSLVLQVAMLLLTLLCLPLRSKFITLS